MISIVSIFLFFRLSDLVFMVLDWLPTGADEQSVNLKRIYFTIWLITIFLFLTGYLLSSATDSRAKLEKMSNNELSEVVGQNLLNFSIKKGQTDVSGTFDGGYPFTINNESGPRETHFARINLDVRLDADAQGFGNAINIDNLRLGYYNDGNRIGDGNDGYMDGAYDGESFWFGSGRQACVGGSCVSSGGANTGWDISSDGLVLDVDNNPIEAEGPYVDFAFENFNSGGNEELVGVRVGFERIRGQARIANLNTLSATIRAQDFGDNGACTAAGHRLGSCNGPFSLDAFRLFNKMQFGGNGSDWGDPDDWTEDFWISFNKKDLFWRHNNPESGTNDASEARFHTDGEGFWLHVTDDAQGGIT